MDEPFDVAVIGGGPSGLSAAIWLARYRARTLLLDAAEQRNRVTEHVHGYLGIDPATPQALLRASRDALEAYEEITAETMSVTSVDRDGDVFNIMASGERAFRSRRVVLSTGVVDVLPTATGFEEHYGSSVFHCPSCDAYEYRDRRICVLGSTPHAAGYARELSRWSDRIQVVFEPVDGIDVSEACAKLEERGIATSVAMVERFAGAREEFQGLELAGGGRVDCDVVFFSLGHLPRTALARSLGCALDDDGYVIVDASGRTSMEHVFACGDCTPGTQLVQIAAASGVLAGIACARTL